MKRFFTICLLICSFFSVFASVSAAADFGDLPVNHKHYPAVVELVKRGVVAGYEDGSFRPENEITRTEFCALVARTMGYTKESYAPISVPFKDVSDEYWGIGFISFCYERGLINGMGNGTFAPAAKVTYEQAVKIAVCAASIDNENFSLENEMWYTPYLRTAEKHNLTCGVDVKVSESAKRSDCAQLVYNVINNGTDGSENSDNEDNVQKEPEENTEDTLTEEEKAEIKQNEIWDELFADKDFSVVKTIVVDAGHNYDGKDNGARNHELNIREEDITWQIANRLAGKLRDMGFDVVMTRETQQSSIGKSSVNDSLKARVDLAHEKLADLFISIHCNIGGGSGTETYCFSKSGNGGRLAAIIQKNICKNTGFYNRGVKTARFYVVKNTRMPAVLVETGFLDNKKDVEILADEAGQEKIAQAIADAVYEYSTGKMSLSSTEENLMLSEIVPEEEQTSENSEEGTDTEQVFDVDEPLQ